jgi:hypothetical protein
MQRDVTFLEGELHACRSKETDKGKVVDSVQDQRDKALLEVSELRAKEKERETYIGALER